MKLARRQLLKGLTTGAVTPLLKPFLNNLHAEHRGVLPKRFLFKASRVDIILFLSKEIPARTSGRP